MKRHNLAFIDIETTGLNPDKHEIIEIGCVLVKQERDKEGLPQAQSRGAFSFEIIEEFELKVKPERIEDAEPEALRINKYDPGAWIFAYTLEEAMKILSDKTKDSIMVAHNIAFDFSFINKAFQTTGVENKMHYHKLDTLSMAFAKLHNKDDVDRFSLASLGKYFGIENKQAHTALSDARAAFEVYKKLMGL